MNTKQTLDGLSAWALAVLVACAALVSCEGDAAGPPDITLPTDFPVSVTTGLTPRFSWQGGNAIGLMVEDVSGMTVTTLMWDVSAAGQAGFPSPVVYGSQPQNSSCLFVQQCTARALKKGTPYVVVVVRADELVGQVRFVP